MSTAEADLLSEKKLMLLVNDSKIGALSTSIFKGVFRKSQV